MVSMQDSTAASSSSKRSKTSFELPCDECRRSRMKCDRTRPNCGTCADRQLPCVYSRSSDSRGDRVRQFHRKSRAGCSSCKARRVRCDEQRPVCGACTRRGEGSLCVFASPPSQRIRASHSSPGSSQSLELIGFDSVEEDPSDRAFLAGTQPSSHSEQELFVKLQAGIDGFASAMVSASYAQTPTTVVGPSSEWTVGFVSEPDPLVSFFPSTLERQQFQHFLFDTAQSLLVVPMPHLANPWLTYIAPLAIGKSKGQDISHDALRSSLLSLATSDLAIKMNQALVGHDSPVMYTTSCAHWRQALAEVKLAIELGMHLEDPGAADMLLATAIALGTRDRLAGWADWEQPLALGHRVLRELGGPDLYITLDPTRLRRFLVEQFVSLEVLGCLTTFKEPKIGDWYNHWLETSPTVDQCHHLEAIYGWDPKALMYSLRGVGLAGEYVRLWELRTRQATNPSTQVQESIQSKLSDCQERIQALIDDSPVWQIHDSAIPSLSSTAVRSFCLLACVDLYLMMVCTEGRDSKEVLQSRVSTIFKAANEIMSRGEVAGLLLPLTWAQGCATIKHREPILKLLKGLGANYHMDRPSLLRTIGVDWADLGEVFPSQWEVFARREGLYFPIY